jgi:cell division protein FtsA
VTPVARIRWGEVDSMSEAERAIRTAVQAAEGRAGARRPRHLLPVGRPSREPRLVGEAEVEGGRVTGGDIGRVLASCEAPDLGAGREVLHAQPVNFALDHRHGIADPRGQSGERLAADLHLLAVDASAVDTLLLCLKRCDLECAGIASSPMPRACRRWWRTSRSWARPASTWAGVRRSLRVSSAST